jgi:hypothetical protein
MSDVSRMSAWPLAWSLSQKLFVARRVAFSAPFLHKAVRVRVSTTGHQGSQYLLQGKGIC